MPDELLVKASYYHDADELFERASNFSDLIDVTSRINTYRGLPPVPMEEGKTYNTDIKILVMFRCDNYDININKVCHKELLMESFESNDVVKLWSHRLQIKPTEYGSIWIDRVIINAGRRTPIISRYARFMYQHRHKHRGGHNIEASLRKTCRRVELERPVFYPAE